MEKIFELQADICKIFSNPKRMEIIHALKDGEMSASDLIERIGISKANLSQHMSVLKSKNVVVSRREGLNVFYQISNPKIHEACHLMREILLDQIQESGKMASRLKQIK